jgi:hypothetical protein
MIISHQKKFIYFHVYKVAGTSIRKALKEHDDLSISDFPFHKNIQFLIGRRIWFLSTWSVDHLKASEAKYYLPENVFKNYFKFSFVRNPWDWQVSIYHYMLQFKFHPQHRIIKKMKTFDEYIEWRINYDLELQKEFVFDKNGKMLVDFVGRFENIQNDFKEICSRLNIPAIDLPVLNTSKHTYYKDYYNTHTRNLIGDAFKDDIITFNYDF